MAEERARRASGSDAVARRLAEVRASLAPDVSLQQFLRILDSWRLTAPVPLVIVTAGGTFRGVLAHRQEWAEYLDEAVLGHLRAAAADGHAVLEEDLPVADRDADEDVASLRTYVEALDRLAEAFEAGRFLRHTRLRQEAEQETAAWLVERYGQDARLQPDVLDIPPSRADAVVQHLAPRNGFALSQAQVRLPGDAGWTDVGYVQVVVPQVSAWWIAP